MRPNHFEWDTGIDIDAVKARIAVHLGARGLQADPLNENNPLGHGLWDHLVDKHEGYGFPQRASCSDCVYLEAHWRIVDERERASARRRC
jgi:hypothetical protein